MDIPTYDIYGTNLFAYLVASFVGGTVLIPINYFIFRKKL